MSTVTQTFPTAHALPTMRRIRHLRRRLLALGAAVTVAVVAFLPGDAGFGDSPASPARVAAPATAVR